MNQLRQRELLDSKEVEIGILKANQEKLTAEVDSLKKLIDKVKKTEAQIEQDKKAKEEALANKDGLDMDENWSRDRRVALKDYRNDPKVLFDPIYNEEF